MRYNQRKNPIGITNSLLLVALFGVAGWATYTLYRNTGKLKGFVADIQKLNKDITDLIPKIQGNVAKLTNITKGLVPKEAQGIANLFK